MMTLVTAFLSAGTSAPATCPTIAGTWRLVSASSRASDGHKDEAPYGPSPSGLLIYTADGHVMAIISNSGRAPLSVNDRIVAPVKERANAFATSFAYAG